MEDTSLDELRDGNTVLQLGVEPNRVDILQRIAGVEFDQVWNNRVSANIAGDLTAPLISVEDLIQNKLQAGRPQDLVDAGSLRAMERTREAKI